VPTIHLSREYSQSPLQGHPPLERNILLFLRGDVGQHRRARTSPVCPAVCQTATTLLTRLPMSNYMV